MKTLNPSSRFFLRRLALLLVWLASASSASACGMWIPCCPDKTPRVGDTCSACQMSKTCGREVARSASSGGGGGDAAGCVRQTEIGSSNIWKYTNTCNRVVVATIIRRCDVSDAAHAGRSRSVSVVFGANETLHFNRQEKFGNFCSTLGGNTNAEGVTSQTFR